MPTQTSEKAIVRNILAYLNSLDGCRARKTHGGPHSQAGEPDIDACLHGRAVKIEVKRPGGYLTRLQKVRLQQWAEAGAVTGMARSVDEVRALLAGEGLVDDEAPT